MEKVILVLKLLFFPFLFYLSNFFRSLYLLFLFFTVIMRAVSAIIKLLITLNIIVVIVFII